jgi:predicted MFS family arabinose efflux permease
MRLVSLRPTPVGLCGMDRNYSVNPGPAPATTPMDRPQRLSRPNVVLFLLTMSYMLNGADRQLVSVLAEPIKQDLLLSDSQLGLLTGFIFSLFYTCCGVPISRAADRFNRVRIVSGACILWSLFTAMSGLALNFAQLALARAGVGVGEAGGTAPSYSLISDYFPAEKRATALAVYTAGLPLGFAFSVWFGGWVAAEHGWRVAFFAVGAPGVLLSLIIWSYIEHPERGRLDPPLYREADRPDPRFSQIVSAFLRCPVLLATVAASSLASFTVYSFMAWMPAFLMRNKGMSLSELSSYYSLVSGSSMIIGLLASGWLVDYFSRWTNRARALVPGIAWATAWPLMLLAVWVPSWQLTLLLIFVPFSLMTMWLPPALATVQNTFPADQRSTAGAIFVLLAAAFGSGAGPTFVGFVSDYYGKFDPATSLQWALTSLIPFALLAAIAYYVTSIILLRSDR